MANAILIALPALTRPQQRAPSVAGRVGLALAAPVLAIVLAWGLVDACAFTQHNLMGLYAASAPASA